MHNDQEDDTHLDDTAPAKGGPKRPTAAQVIDLLRRKSPDKRWSMLQALQAQPGYAKCTWCMVTLRGWQNDIQSHLDSLKHLTKAKGPMLQFVRPLHLSNKRTAAEVSATPKEEILARLLIHVEGCGISYHAFHNLMSPAFLALLREFTGDLPSSTHMRSTHFPNAVTMVKESVDEAVGDSPYSILVDETPEHLQMSFVLISIATPSAFLALHCKVLKAGESINSESLRTLILDVLQERGLLLSNFIAYIADNCAYAKKAYKLLVADVPHLKHIGCLSHVVHLLAQSLFQIDKDTILFPVVDSIAAHLNSLFSRRDAAEERARQERFTAIFSRSPRALFWQVRGRWACKLTSIRWIHDNRVEFLAFLVNEITNFPSHNSLLPLRDLLNSVVARANLAVVNLIAEPLLKFLTQTQADDVVVTMEVYRQLEHFIAGLRTVIDPLYAAPLIRSAISSQLLVLPPAGVAELLTQLTRCISSICDKYDKHLSYLQWAYKWFPSIDPAVFFVTPTPLPPDLISLASNFLLAMGEYSGLIEEGSAVRTAYLTLPLPQRPSVVEFWKANAATSPNVANIAFKLLTLRAGIAGVERQFKLLRAIQTPQRLRMRRDTLEGNFLMRANASLVDIYMRGRAAEEEEGLEEEEPTL